MFQDERVIGHREGLERCGGLDACWGEVGGIRAIQSRHQAVGRCAHDEAVNASTEKVWAIWGDVFVNGSVGLGVFEVAEAGAAFFGVE